MEKELKTKALKIIKNYNSQELNKETYNTIISLANNSLSKKAQEQINKILKLQTRKGELETKDKKTNTTTISSPIKLLQTITIYIKNNKTSHTKAHPPTTDQTRTPNQQITTSTRSRNSSKNHRSNNNFPQSYNATKQYTQ